MQGALRLSLAVRTPSVREALLRPRHRPDQQLLEPRPSVLPQWPDGAMSTAARLAESRQGR